MAVICEDFGRTSRGEDVLAFRLINARGACVRILNRGGVIQSLCVPDRRGNLTDVVLGFDSVAEKIYNYPEVQSVQLMAGGYDLSVLIEGKTMKEVALFVSQKLATIDGVIATATHFVLHKYKDKGVLYDTTEVDERGNI